MIDAPFLVGTDLAAKASWIIGSSRGIVPRGRVFAIDIDSGPSLADIFSVMNLMSGLVPVRPRGKNRSKRFRVERAKARAGLKKHLRRSRR